jgi:L-seryl-tRNA(Ser) seleniumtransferase
VNDPTKPKLRDLPSVSELIATDTGEGSPPVQERFRVDVARQVLGAARRSALDGDVDAIERVSQQYVEAVRMLAAEGPQTVINATGVIVHTNLGRAPVSVQTAEAMAKAAANYLPLEVDLATGERGGRGAEVQRLMGALTGAERTLIVNNNAAAILLTLCALCSGRNVLVSRGELVEIGGGFRIPDVLRQSGAELVEVGTTNRTRISDYQQAIDDSTAAILTVHASNFELSGFTEKPSLAGLAALARQSGVLLIEDVGSGCLVATECYGLQHEPTLAESIEAGVDVVTASGDKLLGGPQAGLILGTAASVTTIARHPLARAVRVDKSVQAGIATTLRHYLRGEHEEKVPIWWMMACEPDQLEDRVARWCEAISDVRVRPIATMSVTGGGSLPGKTQPSFGLMLDVPEQRASTLARLLRLGVPHVFPRIIDERVVLDARTVLPGQDDGLIGAVSAALAAGGQDARDRTS